MAVFAGFRCRLIEEHQVAIHWFLQRVACRTSDVFVPSFQRESGLVMIKKRRLPFIAVVACCAIVGPGAELVGVRILMAIAAIDGGFRKIHVPHCQFHRRRLVAVDAGRRAMRPQERKVCLCVIEPGQIFPLACRVARLAAHRCSGCIAHRHPLHKLPLVHILVAGRAIETSKVEGRYFCTGHRLMAVVAGDGFMSPRQREIRLLVLDQRVGRRLERRPRVAWLASIAPRRAGKLPLMFIGVAIHALGELDLEFRVVPCGHMARSTFHTGVRKDQWESRLCMISD